MIDKPFLFLASNLNLPMILSEIKEYLFSNNEQAILLIVDFNYSNNVELMDEMHKLQSTFKNFNYKIIITKEKPNNNTMFFYVSVSGVLGKIISNLSNHIIYAHNYNKNNKKIYNKIIELGALKENIK